MRHEAGVKLEFLPPYSLDYNSIEESFAELKAWIKKNRILGDSCGSFEEFLKLGMEYISNKAGNHFTHVHIVNFHIGWRGIQAQ